MNVSPTIQPHFTLSTNTHWIMNVSPTTRPHFTFNTHTGLCMYHQQFSHTSHSALTLDYACITNNSATLHIQHLHWIMHVSPTIQPHFTFSTYTGLCMYHHTSHSVLTHTLDYECIINNSATLHIQHLHWIMSVSPTIQPHFTFSIYTGLCMYHQQNSAMLHI